jgi:hypothetical protein
MFKATNFDTAVNSIRRDDSSIENRLIPRFGFGLENSSGIVFTIYYIFGNRVK